MKAIAEHILKINSSGHVKQELLLLSSYYKEIKKPIEL